MKKLLLFLITLYSLGSHAQVKISAMPPYSLAAGELWFPGVQGTTNWKVQGKYLNKTTNDSLANAIAGKQATLTVNNGVNLSGATLKWGGALTAETTISGAFRVNFANSYFDVNVTTNAVINATDSIVIGRGTNQNVYFPQYADNTNDSVAAFSSTGKLINKIATSILSDTNKVSGPASATDEAIAIYDGITGKIIKNSLVTIASEGTVIFPTQINAINLQASAAIPDSILALDRATGNIEVIKVPGALLLDVVPTDASTNGIESNAVFDGLALKITGPATSTDNALMRWDLTTGKLGQNSNAILTDGGFMTLVDSLKLSVLAFAAQRAAVINTNGTVSAMEMEDIGTIGLVLPSIATPSGTAASSTVFSKAVAGRDMLAYVDATNIETILQPHFGIGKSGVIVWQGNTTSTTNFGLAGATVNGTMNSVTPISTGTLFESLDRASITSAATAGSSINVRGNGAKWFTSATAGKGGYFFVFQGGIEVTAANARGFVGMKSNTAIGNGEPEALTDMFGFAFNAGQATWKVMHNDGSGTATTAVDLGSNFPTTALEPYRFFLMAKPGVADSLWYRIERVGTAFVSSGFVTGANLPTVGVMRNWEMWLNNGVTAAAVEWMMQSVYVKTKN